MATVKGEKCPRSREAVPDAQGAKGEKRPRETKGEKRPCETKGEKRPAPRVLMG